MGVSKGIRYFGGVALILMFGRFGAAGTASAGVLQDDQGREVDEIYSSEIRTADRKALDLDISIQLRDSEIKKVRERIVALSVERQQKDKKGEKATRVETYAMNQAAARFGELVAEQNMEMSRKFSIEQKRDIYKRLRKDGILTTAQMKERQGEIQKQMQANQAELQEFYGRQLAVWNQFTLDSKKAGLSPEDAQAAYKKVMAENEAAAAQVRPIQAKTSELGQEMGILFGLTMLDSVQAHPSLLDPNTLVEMLDKNYGYRSPDSACEMGCSSFFPGVAGGGMSYGYGGYGGYGGAYGAVPGNPVPAAPAPGASQVGGGGVVPQDVDPTEVGIPVQPGSGSGF